MTDTPSAPDPYATADAQTKSNLATAKQTQEMNMVNQVTPYGSLSYSQNGTNPDGTPKYTATTSLSPSLSGLVDTNIGNAQSNANLEGSLLKNAAGTLSKPLDLSWGATEANLDALGRKTLDPQFAQSKNDLEQSLYNRGVTPGSEAYTYQMGQLANQQGQQYDNLYLQGHNTAVNDLTAEYNSPLNALTALRSGSQVSQPGIGTTSTPTTAVQGTNISGLIQQNYQDELASSNAAMSGLFGLGGSLLGGLTKGLSFSDRRLKRDIRLLGTWLNGLPVYAFRYLWSDRPHVGFMADEVAVVCPEAVVEGPNGFLMVDYHRAMEA